MTTQPDLDERWAQFRHHAARHQLRRLARAAGPRHRRGWPPFDPAEFSRFHGFGGFKGFGGPAWGRGPRAARGDIRAAILVLLAEQPSHGYQIIQELEGRSGGAWRVSPGSVYPTLQQLEDEGLVRTVNSETDRRVYELTDAGREEAKRHSAGPAPWDEVAGSVGSDVSELGDLVIQLAAATWQVARAGQGWQVARAKELLRETRRQLYLLLADGPSPSEPAAE